MDERFRLDKLLSMAGMTRSEARRAIASGRAQVAGQVVRDAAARVAIAEVRLDGRPLEVEVDLYLMVNKPAGVVTATEDARFPTVVGLLPERLRRRGLGPVGRLDRDVGGLVLLTTDGVLAHRLISPRWKAEKVYFAREVRGGSATATSARLPKACRSATSWRSPRGSRSSKPPIPARPRARRSPRGSSIR